jgi:hypothetical protein
MESTSGKGPEPIFAERLEPKPCDMTVLNKRPCQAASLNGAGTQDP